MIVFMERKVSLREAGRPEPRNTADRPQPDS